MRLTRNSAYAVFAIFHVASHARGAVVPVSELADLCVCSVESMEALLGQLVTAGILRRVAGSPGGYALNKAPDEITLLEIAEVINGKQDDGLLLPTQFGRPNASSPAARPEGRVVSNHEAPALKVVRSIASAVLAGHTVADLLEGDKRSKAT